MTLFSFYMYNKYGDCIYSHSWPIASSSSSSTQQQQTTSSSDRSNLVAGLVYTLQLFSAQLSSTGTGGFRSMKTPCYRLHYHETVSKYRLVLLTDSNFEPSLAQEVLQEIFDGIFCEWIVRDVQYRHAEGCLIQSPLMGTKLKQYVLDKKLINAA